VRANALSRCLVGCLLERPIKARTISSYGRWVRIDIGLCLGLISIDDIDLLRKAYPRTAPSLQLVLLESICCGLRRSAYPDLRRSGNAASSIVREFRDGELLEVEAVANEERAPPCSCRMGGSQRSCPVNGPRYFCIHSRPSKACASRLGELAAQVMAVTYPNANDLLEPARSVCRRSHMARELLTNLSHASWPWVAELVYMMPSRPYPCIVRSRSPPCGTVPTC